MPTPLFRKPQRISITVPHQLYLGLIERADREGRSISNLSAFLLETALAEACPEVEPARHDRAA